MADLTANAPIRILGEATTERFQLDTSAAQHVYKGQPLLIDQSADTDNKVGFVDALTVATTDVFMGIAAMECQVALGADETALAAGCEAYVEPTIVGFKSAVFSRADLGKSVTMSDSGTLSVTTLANPRIGILYDVRDGYAYVRLQSPYICSGAGA